MKLHEDPTEKKREKPRIGTSWVRGHNESQGRLMNCREECLNSNCDNGQMGVSQC